MYNPRERFKLLYDYYDGNGKKYQFNGTVSIGDYGTVFCHEAMRGKKLITGGFKFGRKTEYNYLQVNLTDMHGKKALFYIHRLVASAWLDKKPHQIDVMHLDDNPLNNHKSNLRWCTTKENMEDKANKGRAKVHRNTKYDISVLIDIYNRRQMGEKPKDIYEDYKDTMKKTTFNHFSSGRVLLKKGII